MRKVNVGIAVEVNTFAQLLANSVMDEDGIRANPDFTEEQYKQLNGLAFNFWKDVTSPTGTFKVVSFTIDRITPEDSEQLSLVELMAANYPGMIVPIGAWNRDGSQYGTTIVPATQDDEGAELTPEIVTGTPVYPIHPLMLMAMPDDVTYADDGTELTRTPSTEPKNVHKVAGWKDRRWV